MTGKFMLLQRTKIKPLTILIPLILLITTFFSTSVFSAIKWIEINGIRYYDGSTFYYACNEQYFIKAYRRDEVNNLNIPFAVTFWEFSSHLTTNGNITVTNTSFADNPLLVSTNSGGGGTGYVKAKMDYPFDATVTINLVNFPRAGIFTTAPNVCNGETKTFRFDPIISNYSGIQWEGINGVTVNGQISYTSSFGERNADINSSAARGIIRARVVDICGTGGEWAQLEVGTPAITQAFVNGVPATGFNYINNPAELSLQQQRATSYSWTVDGGNGNLYPSGSWCTAYAYDFVRVRAEVINSCGVGNSYTFYLNNGNAYIAYPNPANNELNIEFTDKIVAEKFLNEISLKNEKGEIVKKIDVADAKQKKSFENKKSIDIDVRNLSKNTYYLNVIVDGKEVKQKILIEK